MGGYIIVYIITTIPLKKNYLSNNRNDTLYNKKLFQLPIFYCCHVLFSHPPKDTLVISKTREKRGNCLNSMVLLRMGFKHSIYVYDLTLKKKGCGNLWVEGSYIYINDSYVGHSGDGPRVRGSGCGRPQGE